MTLKEIFLADQKDCFLLSARIWAKRSWKIRLLNRLCVFLLLYSEKGKVDTSVVTVLEKAGMILKVEVFSMFQNENTFRLEQVVLKYQVGYACQFFQGIRRVSKIKSNCRPHFSMYLNTSALKGMHLSVLTSRMTLLMKAWCCGSFSTEIT